MSVTLGTTGITFPDATTQTTAAIAFPSGTRLSFQQTTAPTGWTKDTTAAINDSILRLVTGTVATGGTVAFSTWNAQTATGAVTLSTAQMPSHAHNIASSTNSESGLCLQTGWTVNNSNSTDAQGGGGSHSHSLSQGLKYYDFIIASAN